MQTKGVRGQKMPINANVICERPLNELDWQCYLADSSKMAPRILIFSIAMDANNSFYVKFIATLKRPHFLDILFQS